MNQKEIAVQEGLSQAKVTRALQAASVSSDLITLFPVQSELTFSDYKLLSSIEENLHKVDVELKNLIETVTPDIHLTLADEELAEDEVKNRILKILLKESEILTKPGAKERAIVENLWNFSDKDRFARKRSKGRLFSYEFNRLPKNVQDELDIAIEAVLKRNLN